MEAHSDVKRAKHEGADVAILDVLERELALARSEAEKLLSEREAAPPGS